MVETVRQRAELYKVGPYYAGPVDPQFQADGKPYGWVEPVDNGDTTEPDGGDV